MINSWRRLAVAAVITAPLFLASACTTESGTESSPSPTSSSAPAEIAQATGVSEATQAALQQQLTTQMAQFDVPGAVVAVCVPGKDPYVLTEGVSDVAAGTPMTSDLVWPLRSVTKSFTVTLLLQLVDEGKMSLDDTIGTWVPGVPNGDQITLRELANMTSGVPEYTTQAWIDDFLADENRNFTTSELISYALAEPAQFPPGSLAVYVNTSTLLIGQAVSAVAGADFPAVLEQRILTPLGLTNTEYPLTANDWSGPHPTGYQPNADGQLEAQVNNFTVFGPAGQMTSTVPDLCRWGSALGQGELLTPATQQARIQGQPLAKGPDYDIYALGIGQVDGWWGHTGEGFGHTLLVMNNPETNVTAVVLMNESKAAEHVPTSYFRAVAGQLSTVGAQE